MKKIIIAIFIITGMIFAETVTNHITQSWINNQNGFEENRGQMVDGDNNPVWSLLFKINLPGHNIYLTEHGASFVLYQREHDQMRYARFDIEAVGSRIEKGKVEMHDEIPGHTNYFLSHCPDGIMYVKSYRHVKINDIYPGINWIWRFDDRVHSEFEVKPHADLSNIKLNVKWADVEIKDGKELVYTTPIGKINEGVLYVYQKDGAPISAFYSKDQQGFITFDIKNYDKNKTLIIDPPFERLWATYYGGSGQDNCDGSREMGAITADNSGNIYITGFTGSTNFPTLNPGAGAYFQGTVASAFDAFIVKFNNNGQREWATYYGGISDDIGIALATDSSENLFVTGVTFSSTTFPTYNPGGGAYFQSSSGGSGDVFVLKFSNTGLRQWATYYGGYQSDVGYAIATDPSGNIFITGNTFSSNLPTYDAGSGAYFQPTNAGSFDAFILKFSNAGVRLWATYYGGSDDDNGYGIAADTAGNVFITGMCRSTNFPILDAGGGAYFQSSILGYRTVFILKFNNNGVRTWATYYGGSTNDYGRAITADSLGNIFITGNTSSTNFPVLDAGGGAYFQGTIAGSDDAFILKFDNSGIRIWSTYYGGTTGDIARTITTHPSGMVYVSGNTLSANFPTYDPGNNAYYQAALGGGHDVFILGFNNTGARQWATYYGGASTDYGMSLATDATGNIFLSGFTLSSGFPVYNPGGGAYYQGTNAGSYDAYVLKFASASTGITEAPTQPRKNLSVRCNTFFTDRIVLRLSDFSSGDIKISIYNTLGANLYQKTLPGGATLILNDRQIRNLKSGIYYIRLESDNQRLGRAKVIKR
ncbi:MAG: SBBP repeat-containing protein [Candidatus Latescibacteria bacterium]|nr:SBBP repeat-containing protein [Candidatus Latescibacterota bacterium]